MKLSTGIMASSMASGGSSYDPAAVALFARMTTPPSDARKTLINDLIVALKAAGVWAQLLALYVTAAADAQAAGLNWISATYNLVPLSSPTFTVDRGYTGGGAAYLSTGISPSVAGFTVAEGTMGVWYQGTPVQNDSGADGGGNAGTNGYMAIGPRTTANVANSAVWAATFASGANSTGGLLTVVRAAGPLTTLYKGSSGSIATSAAPALGASPPPETLYLCGYNDGGAAVPHSSRIAAAFFSTADFSGADVTAINDALQDYMTAVGA